MPTSHVTSSDISESLRLLGLEEGDVCLFHSSFKSFGFVTAARFQLQNRSAWRTEHEQRENTLGIRRAPSRPGQADGGLESGCTLRQNCRRSGM